MLETQQEIKQKNMKQIRLAKQILAEVEAELKEIELKKPQSADDVINAFYLRGDIAGLKDRLKQFEMESDEFNTQKKAENSQEQILTTPAKATEKQTKKADKKREYHKKYWEEHKEKLKAYISTPERKKIRAAQMREKMKDPKFKQRQYESQQKYRKNHAAELAAKKRQKRAENPEHYREINRKYRENHPDRVEKQKLTYYEKNKDLINQRQRTRYRETVNLAAIAREFLTKNDLNTQTYQDAFNENTVDLSEKITDPYKQKYFENMLEKELIYENKTGKRSEK